MSKADESRLSASLSPTASPTARATRRHLLLGGSALAAAAAALSVAKPVLAQTLPSGSEILPVPDQPFRGVIGRKASESTPDFPKAVTAPEGAPNVLLIMTDDVGFGAASTFGGPIPTPTLERLAANGLRYNEFHTTALCSPTRAALLTGRNHQSVGMGNITEFATGYPGYTSIIPKSAGTIGNILVDNGYNTAWFGKHHLVPEWMQGPGGPFDQWAGGLGFEYFYGFLGGDTDQWHPALFENTTPVLPPSDDPNYILIHDLADRAINWIRTQHAAAPDKPFFLYFAPGNSHAPHHAPKDWIAKFKGQFDQGWDKVREETLARQIRLGVVPAGTRPHAAPEGNPSLGFAQRRPEEGLCADDGGLRRGHRSVATTRSGGSSTPCRNPGNSTTRSSSISRATTAPAPKARCKGRPTKSPPSLRPSPSSFWSR